MVYDGVYTADDIPTLTRCSTCRNLFRADQETVRKISKVCDACKQVGAKNRKKTRMTQIETGLCKAIVLSTRKPCQYKPLKNDEYCKKHQRYKWWKTVTDSGKKVCKNWERNCMTILEEHEQQYSYCKTCRYANSRHSSLCQLSTIPNIPKKSSSDMMNQRYTTYRAEAKRRHIAWYLDMDTAQQLFSSPCHYCNYQDGRTGIDRVDSAQGYQHGNVVPCCFMCNGMKHTHSKQTFLRLVCHLVTSMELISSTNSHSYYYPELFQKANTKKSYEAYKRSSLTDRGITMELTKEMYDALLKDKCAYCKNFQETGANGIDRRNNAFMYIPTNCVACCSTCNHLKHTMNELEFSERLVAIYKTSILHIPQQYDTPRIKMISLLTRNNYKIPHRVEPKLMASPQTYHAQQYKAFTLEDIKRIRVELVFIDPSTMHEEFSMWKYYKHSISSMTIRPGHRHPGKQIYILVKDCTTQTVLGVVSLSSDIKNLKARDAYIGWTSHDIYQKQRLQKLLNMTTCVPTQPFGYNMNGGKLLTSLMFSREVQSHIFQKYGSWIQGITTLSIYGKSIQYDRLSCLKFLGYSRGYSTMNIPQEVIDYARTIDNRHSDTLFMLKKVFSTLNIPIDDFTRHIRKGIYFGYTHPRSKEFLCSQTEMVEPNPLETAKTVEEITEWWKQRWAIQRFTHLTNMGKMKEGTTA